MIGYLHAEGRNVPGRPRLLAFPGLGEPSRAWGSFVVSTGPVLADVTWSRLTGRRADPVGGGRGVGVRWSGSVGQSGEFPATRLGQGQTAGSSCIARLEQLFLSVLAAPATPHHKTPN